MEKPAFDETGLRETIRSRIDQAKQSALPEGELESIKKQQNQAVRDYLSGKIDYTQFDQIKIDNEHTGVARFDTLVEFRMGLESIGFKKDQVEDILRHENDHMATLESLGGRGYYQMQLCVLWPGHYAGYPSVAVEALPDSSDDEKRSMYRQIYSAPEELSPSDENVLRDGDEAGHES